MPLLRRPTTEDLEDHFFGSHAFQYGWFDTRSTSFPATVTHYKNMDDIGDDKEDILITESEFLAGIRDYSETLLDRSFDDLIEDMDSSDVDNVIQLILFGEIRYA